MRWILGVCAGLIGILAAAKNCQAVNVPDMFDDFSLTVGATRVLPGRLYTPPVALSDPTSPRPLILFMHGSGESGTDNLKQLDLDIYDIFGEAQRQGMFLYAPQAAFSWTPTDVTSNIETMLARAVADHNVDVNRIYITGVSMGGGGVWNMLSRFPDRFAAGVPIAGVAPGNDFNPAHLVDQAVWAYHSRNDGIVSVNNTRDRINSILVAAGEAPLTFPPLGSTSSFGYFGTDPDLRYVERPTGGHSIWNTVYSNNIMYDWLFSHTLAVPEPSSISLVSIAGLLLGGQYWRKRRRAAAA